MHEITFDINQSPIKVELWVKSQNGATVAQNNYLPWIIFLNAHPKVLYNNWTVLSFIHISLFV